MNLKKDFNIVWQPFLKPVGVVIRRQRKAISVNSIHQYIGEKRAEFIKQKLREMTTDKRRFSVQNKGYIDAYLK